MIVRGCLGYSASPIGTWKNIRLFEAYFVLHNALYDKCSHGGINHTQITKHLGSKVVYV